MQIKGKVSSQFKNRTRMPRRKSKRLFAKTADRSHYKNSSTRMPMRGGIRL